MIIIQLFTTNRKKSLRAKIDLFRVTWRHKPIQTIRWYVKEFFVVVVVIAHFIQFFLFQSQKN